MRRVLLLNDTHDVYHFGCTATSAAIRKRIDRLGLDLATIPVSCTYNFQTLPRQLSDFDDPDFFRQASAAHPEVFAPMAESDVVVINGEGTLHHMRQPAVALLYMAYAAKKHLGKRVQIINHSVYPDSAATDENETAFQVYRLVYEQMDFIAIREHLSHELLHDSGIASTLSFDCLPLTVRDVVPHRSAKPARHVVLAGSAAFAHSRLGALSGFMQKLLDQDFSVTVLIGSNGVPAQDDQDFVSALKQQRVDGWELQVAESLDAWLDCLRSASLLVSGRFHHTIAAAFLGVPCVVLESNTPKNRALTEILGIEPPLDYDDDRFETALFDRSHRALDEGSVNEAILDVLADRAERNFDGLRNIC